MIHLVVALPAEAGPLVAHFGLKGDPHAEPYRLYGNDRMALIVSGVGKVAAAAATAYLHVLTGSVRNRPWLNLGVGGHREWPVGKGILAHKITDRATSENWYPPLVFDPPCGTAEVVTVDRITQTCEDDAVHEMEAAGFYDTACRFSTAELVHCYKIVSDNPAASVRSVTPEQVKCLITQHLGTIDTFVTTLTSLSDTLARIEADPLELQEFLHRWHFTVTEQHRLRRALRRRRLLAPGRPDLECAKTAGDVLARLERDIESIPVHL